MLLLLRNGKMVKLRYIVLLVGFLGVGLETTVTATCLATYRCDIYCQNETYGCYDCLPFYGLSNPSSSPPYICSKCGVDCLQCRQGLSCTKCRIGYGPAPGYLPDPWNCAPCETQNCLSCPADIYVCQQCMPGFGFYPNRTTCGVCSAHCAAGCDTTGAGKCDRCDSGYGLTTSGCCSAELTTSGFYPTTASSLNQSRPITYDHDLTTAWITPAVGRIPVEGNKTCPILEIGIGIGAPSGFIIIVLAIIIIVLCIQNRSLRRYNRQTQGQTNMQSRAIDVINSAGVQRYSYLDNISTTGTESTNHYERPID